MRIRLVDSRQGLQFRFLKLRRTRRSGDRVFSASRSRACSIAASNWTVIALVMGFFFDPSMSFADSL
jgi:hypothetical protein